MFVKDLPTKTKAVKVEVDSEPDAEEDKPEVKVKSVKKKATNV
jgi:hypothetical protein